MPSINSLKPPAIRAWVNAETYTPRKQNADDTALKQGVVDLNDALTDLHKHYQNSSAPDYKPQGKQWYDSGSSLLKLYHTTDGTPATVLDSTYAYNQSLATAGTATFKLGGAIDVNTTQVSRSAAGDLMSYTSPGATLGTDGQCLLNIAFGTYSTVSNANSAFGATTFQTPNSSGNVATDWFSKLLIVRTGAASQKVFGITKLGLDALAWTLDLTNFVKNYTAAETLSGSSVLKYTWIAGTVTQEIMVTKLLN